MKLFIRPRIIPTLLIDEGNLVKTKQFKNPNYLGDPINAIKIFNEKNVDELCVLDISASKKGKEPNMDLLLNMASEAFMPLSYGGGITDFNQIKEIFALGFEKVVLNTALVNDSKLVTEAVEYFGGQSIVASVDYKTRLGKERCYINDATQKTNYTPVDMAKYAEKLGVGEILLYSMERDGTKKGYDLKTIAKVVGQVKVPVIACGGAGNICDLRECLEKTGVHAVAAGSMFVYFGTRDAVLINFPEEDVLIKNKIFRKVDGGDGRI